MSEQVRWIACYVAAKPNGAGGTAICKGIFVVIANSKHEASGKAMAIAKRSCPVSDNWASHDVIVAKENEIPIVDDPEAAKVTPVTLTP